MQKNLSENNPAAIQASPSAGTVSNPPNWQDHIILCGVNSVALRIVEQLESANIPVVIIDDEPEERQARVLEKTHKLIREDSRLSEVLVRAGLRQAAAVITVKNDDLHNLETVLAANEEVPGIRTVGSFFNQEIGNRLVSTVENARSVSLSEKAGPAFVSAAIPSRLLSLFNIKASRNTVPTAVVQVAVSQNGMLSQLYPNLTVLALQKGLTPPPATPGKAGAGLSPRQRPASKTGDFIICPPDSTLLEPGDLVTVAGQVEELERLEAVQLTRSEIRQAQSVLEATSDKPISMRESPRKRNRFSRARSIVGRMLRQMGRPFRIALLAVILVILAATVVFKFTYNYTDPAGKITELDWISALYFTVTIITTTGFGDFNLSGQEWPLKVFGIFVMLSGATVFACLYAFLTNFLISIRLDEELGRQQATEMENHIVVCGLGTIGYKTIRGLLERGQQVVVIEQNPSGRFNAQVKALGVPVIRGDSRLRETMLIANFQKASCISILTSDDLVNLETALIARTLKPDIRVVLRLFDRGLADKIERTFGIHIARSASAMAAPAFIAEAFDYIQLSSFYIDRVPFTAAQEAVEAGSQLSGLSIAELQHRAGVVVLAHLRKPIQVALGHPGQGFIIPSEDLVELPEIDPAFHPPSNLLINHGDIIVFMGPYDRIVKVHQLNLNLTRSDYSGPQS